MAGLTINNEDLTALKGKVVVLTGGASGIGLATTNLLLDLGALVVSGDINPPPTKHEHLIFLRTDVTSWTDLSALFSHAKQQHGRIDHVFANAGIAGRSSFLEDKLDADGKLAEPNHLTLDINLRAVVNTSALAFHYFRHQEPAGGSVVATASCASFTRFRIVDYTTAKHGVLGFIRGMLPALKAAGLPSIRVNGLAPNWTATGIVPKEVIEATGAPVQGPEIVARSACLLMADESRQGQLIYSNDGEFREIEDLFLKYAGEVLGDNGDADAVLDKVTRGHDFQHDG